MKPVAPSAILALAISSCARPAPHGASDSRDEERRTPSSVSATPATSAGAGGRDVDVPFTWATPEGWKHETIPFPLDFAPSIPYRGTEEIRFMPGFFDPQAPGYFSYVFAWILEDRPALRTAAIAANLQDYFVGLARAVANGKFEVDPARVRVTLADVHPDEARANDVAAFAGTARVIDAFTTRRDVDLALEGEERGDSRHRVVLITASPRVKNDATWTALRACAASFALRAR